MRIFYPKPRLRGAPCSSPSTRQGTVSTKVLPSFSLEFVSSKVFQNSISTLVTSIHRGLFIVRRALAIFSMVDTDFNSLLFLLFNFSIPQPRDQISKVSVSFQTGSCRQDKLGVASSSPPTPIPSVDIQTSSISLYSKRLLC